MPPAAPSDRLHRLAGAAEAELHRLIPFWLALRDPSGGFAGRADASGQAVWSADKGAVLQARILWFFSKAATALEDPALLDAASHACRFVTQRLVDPHHGGVIWTSTASGAPTDAQKHLYAQAFAIQGLAAFHQARGDAGALGLAQELWRTVERHAADAPHGGYQEAFTADWRPRSNDLMGRPAAPKSFNAHLHLLEAYGALWEAWPDPELGRRIEALLALLTGPMFDRGRRTFRQFFDPDLAPLGDGGSWGHDIEASWLIPAIAARLSPVAGAAAAGALAGVPETLLANAPEEPGGLPTGITPSGRPDRRRIWWIQAEALVGFLDAYERQSDPRFLAAAEHIWDFIDRALIDRAHGEWRWRPNTDGPAPPNAPKASLWKCPYHNGRACLEVMTRARRLAG